jgi:hypothetical protein
MAAGGVGTAAQLGGPGAGSNGGATASAAATPLHGSAAASVNGDGYDSDGYNFAPP